jgi:solute carrier family 25 protein 42
MSAVALSPLEAVARALTRVRESDQSAKPEKPASASVACCDSVRQNVASFTSADTGTARAVHGVSVTPPPGGAGPASAAGQGPAVASAPSNGNSGILRFLAGGIAGASAKTLVAPLDRVKIIFQISHKPFSLREVLRELSVTVRDEGVRALFRGNGAQILRVYPYSGIQLLAFDSLAKAILAERGSGNRSAASQLSPLERMCAGGGAGAISVVATYPLDLLRARLAVQQELPGGTELRYRGIRHAVSSMVAEGGVRSLYRGMAPTLLGIMPYAGISFGTYETLKQMAAERAEGRPPPDWQRLLFGGVAGLAGQASTYPLDIVRRRMQTEGYTPIHAHAQPPLPGGATAPSSGPLVSAIQALRTRGRSGGMLEVLGRVVDREGGRGLFKGLSMNAIKGPIAVGVSLTTYDALKVLLDIEHGHRGGGHA